MSSSPLKAVLTRNYPSILIVTATTCALILHALNLDSIINSDEIFYKTAALTIINHSSCGPFATTTSLQPCNLEHPPFAKLLMAGSMYIFGTGNLGVRLPSILSGVLSIPVMGWLASSLSGGNQRIIAAAAVLLSTSPTWFLLSSVGMLDSMELFFGLLALAVYFSKFGKEKTRLLASGMLMGLSILSKEEGVLLLAGLLAYELIFGRPKRAFYVFASSFITVLAVLWAYDFLYTPFANPLQHIQFIVDTGFRLRYQAGFLASPIEWFYQSREILLAVLSLIWLPLAIFTVYRWRRDTLRLPALSASLLLMSPLPLVLLYYVDHRQEYLFYELQLIPVLVLGASWLLSSLRIPRLVLTITLIVAVLLFALALPTLQSIYINTQWRI